MIVNTFRDVWMSAIPSLTHTHKHEPTHMWSGGRYKREIDADERIAVEGNRVQGEDQKKRWNAN